MTANAGGSKSLTQTGALQPAAASSRRSASGSAVLRVARSSALNTAGVASPVGGFTSTIRVS